MMAFAACHTSSVVVSKKKHKKGTHEPWGLNTEVKAKPVDTIEYAPKHIKEILSHQDSFKTRAIYKVALILPFQLDSFYKDKKTIEYNNIPKGVYPALDFYEGCLIAIDSLKNTKLNMELTVLDYSSTHQDFQKLAVEKKIESMDLLMGTLNSSDAKIVADYAFQHKINFVSPIANSFSPEYNPYYISLNPTASNQQVKLLDMVEEKYGHNINAVIVRQDNVAESNVASTSISSLLNKFSNIHPVELVLPNRTSTDSIKYELDSTRRNVVFVASNDLVFINAVVKKLNLFSNSYLITVLGLPSWSNHENLKTIVGKKLEVFITNSYWINRSNQEQIKFHKNFTDTYHIKPSELAIRGYNTMLLCGTGLIKYGVQFNYFMGNDIYKATYGNILLKPVIAKEKKREWNYIKYYNNQQINIYSITSNGINKL
jgi:ABC-type branched-subunit amino acid transport system substrate-binding protein